MAFNPYFFNDSPLSLELIHKALKELAYINPTLEDVKNKVDALVADLDGAIKDEVARVIDEMYESGEFESILKEVAENFLTSIPLNTNIDYHRIYRHLYDIGDSRRYLSNNVVRPSYVQGATVVTIQGFVYYVYSLIPSPTGASYGGVENSGIIVIYDSVQGRVSGQIPVVMGHMNSMCYNEKDGYIYISWTSILSNGGTTESSDARISRVAFEDIIGKNVNITDFSETMESVAYETKTVNTADTLMVGVGNLSYENKLNENEIYIGARSVVYKYNFETNTIGEQLISTTLFNEIINIQIRDGFIWQNAIVKDNYCYLLTYKKSQIMRINLTTQKIEYIYDLSNVMDSGNYALGEPESLYLDNNGDMYIFSSTRLNDKTYAELDMVQIFKQNIFKNNIPLEKAILTDSKRRTVYVDNTNTEDVTPNGTTDKPFRYVTEAVHWAQTQTLYGGVTIELKTDSNWFVQLSTNKSIRITYSNNPTTPYTDEHNRATIGGIHANGCGTVTLSGLRIYQSLINGRQSSYVSLLDGNFILNNNKVIASSGAVAEICYNCNFCNVILTGGSNFTVEQTRKIEGETIGVVWDSRQENSIFMTGTCYSANCHGFAVLNKAIIG